MSDMDWTVNEHASLAIDGDAYEVLGLEARDGVSELFRYAVACVSDEARPPASALIGARAELRLRDGYGAERPVRGIVAEASTRVFDEGRVLLEVVVRPRAFALTVGRDCRVFQDMSVVDIVKDVLARADIPARWSLVGDYPEHVYTAQYRESDYNFVCRLLEEEGIYHWFDHDEGESELVFADRSPAAPELFGGVELPFEAETGMVGGKEHLFQLGPETELGPSKFTLRSFDPDRPSLRVEGVSGDGEREIYDARAAGPTEPSIAQARTQVRLEAMNARRATVRGQATSIRLVPGRIFETAGHEVERLDGRYFVTRTVLTLRQRQKGSEGQSSSPPETEVWALDGETPYRAPRRAKQPRQDGLQIGQVVGPGGEEVYPDEKGRVRVQYFWDRVGARDEKAGKWMRVAQRGSAGSMLLPRMGWNVVTMSEEGSIDSPVVLNRFFDAEHPPPYALPQNKTKTTFRTATTPGGGTFNEIRFEDAVGSEEMFINATRDMNTLVQDSRLEQIKASNLRTVGVDSSVDVKMNAVETVVADQVITVGGNQDEAVGSGRNKTVNGNETITIGGNRKLETGQVMGTDVTGTRELAVAAAQIDVALGDITATAPSVHTLVGGVAIKLTVGDLNEAVGKAISFGGITGPSVGGTLQTIGGAKVEVSKGLRSITVARNYIETVGGMMSLSTMEAYEDRGTNEQAISAGGAITAKSEDVTFQGATEVLLECGGSSIKIDASTITITSGTVTMTGGGLIEATGASVAHN